jgi:hypothetical protein
MCPRSNFFSRIKTRESATLFSVGLVLPTSVYLNFRQVRERGDL